MHNEQPPNIALVVLDTLRKDYFDQYFEWLPGLHFDSTYSTSQWTIPAHASLFTGRYPREVGVHSKHLQFDCPQPSLAEILTDHGYTTQGFSANPNLSGHFGFDRGFDTFESPLELMHLNSDQVVNWKSFIDESPYSGLPMYVHGALKCVLGNADTIKSLRSGFQQVLSDNTYTNPGGSEEGLNWVTRQTFEDPSFLFLNLMEAHEPYRAPEEYMTVEAPDLTHSIGDFVFEEDSKQIKTSSEQIRTAYECCVRYLSDRYRDMFEKLSDRFDYIITIADHGELLGEHEAWNHEHGVYPELTHIPLVVSGDGLSGKSKETISIMDVYATILELAGIDRDQEVRGRDLLNKDTNGSDILTEYTGLTPWSEERLRNNSDSNAIVQQYDKTLYGIAGSDGYAYQTISGMNFYKGNLEDPENKIKKLLDTIPSRDVDPSDDLPDNVRQQLEDLGYA